MDIKLKDIPGFETLYSISEDGEVFSKRKNKFIKGSIVKSLRGHTSYKYYSIRNDNKSYSIGAHRLVAMTYIGIINNGYVVNHIDGNGLNNQLSNLEIISIKNNCLHGAILYDEKNIIQKIIFDFENGIQIDDISYKYKKSIETIKSILDGNNYYGLKAKCHNFHKPLIFLKEEANDSEIYEINKLYETGNYLQRDLIEIFKITRSGIRSAIRKGKSRKNN